MPTTWDGKTRYFFGPSRAALQRRPRALAKDSRRGLYPLPRDGTADV